MFETSESPFRVETHGDRRSSLRRKVTGLSYIQLGQSDGGFLLDISEGGLAFQPFENSKGGDLGSIRFQLPHSGDWIESSGKPVWISEARAAAGLQFVDLPEAARGHIRNWISWHGADAEASGAPMRASGTSAVAVESMARGFDAPSMVQAPSDAAPPASPAAQPPADLAPALAALAPTLKALTEAAARGEIAPKDLGIPNSAGPGASVPAASATRAAWGSAPAAAAAQSADGQVHVVVQLRSPWTLALLVSVLVVFSFAIGVVVGHGFLDRWLGTAAGFPSETSAAPAASRNPTLPATAGTHPPPSSGTAAGFGGASALNSGSTPNAVPGASATSKPTVPRSVTNSGTSVSGTAPAPGDPAARAGFGSTLTLSVGGATTFSQPEHSISANATTAITSRRSMVLPVSAAGTVADPGPTFHFGALADHPDPSYPPEAIDQHLEGTVGLLVTVARDGSVKSIEAQSGPDLLAAASVATVRMWRYKPTYLNTHAVETTDLLRIIFQLPH